MGTPGRKWVRWNAKMRAAFLDHLAATCNVKEAAAEIGVEPASVYLLRRRDPQFAADWLTALQLGYDMLETLLVGHALTGGGRTITIGDTDRFGPIDTDLALRLLSAHRNAMLGKGRRGGPRPGRATTEETNAAILKKLATLEKRHEAA